MPAKKCTKVDENVFNSKISDIPVSDSKLEATEEEIDAAKSILSLGEAMAATPEIAEQHNGIEWKMDKSVRVYRRFLFLLKHFSVVIVILVCGMSHLSSGTSWPVYLSI